MISIKYLIYPFILFLCAAPALAVAQQDEADAVATAENLFDWAMEERMAGEYDSAIIALKRILYRHPELHRAKLELAVAYYQTLEYDKAITLAREVLEAPDTPAAVKVNILAFIARATKSQSVMHPDDRLRLPFSIGYLYDSNVNAGPHSRTVAGGGIVTPDSQAHSDQAKIITAGIRHTGYGHAFTRFMNKPLLPLWQSGVTLYHQGYFDFEEYDLNILSIRTGPAIIVRKQWRASLLFQEEIIMLGDDKLGNYHSVGPGLTFRLRHNIDFSLSGRMSRRIFNEDHAEVGKGRDSTYWDAGFGLAYLPAELCPVTINTSYKYLKEDADQDIYSSEGYEISGTITWNLDEQKALSAGILGQHLDYGDQVELYNEKRHENLMRYTIGFRYQFRSDHPWTDNWALEGKTIFERMHSNIDVYEYDRDQLVVSLAKTF